MEKYIPKSFRQIIAMVLCLAMVLPMIPVSARATDTVTVSDVLAAEDAVKIPVSSPSIEFVPASEPFKQEGRYLLMSNAYGHIMSFDATAAPQTDAGTESTGSITLDTDGDSENTYYFGGAKGTSVIIDNSDRHFAIWNMRQYKEAHLSQILVENGSNLQTQANTAYGGVTYYRGIELQKRTNSFDSYWYCTGDASELRHLCYRSDASPFKNEANNSGQTGTDVRSKYILDSIGTDENGVPLYLIYFWNGLPNTTDYRVLYCDESGTWSVKRYNSGNANTDYNNMLADREKLALRLYEYKETEVHKSVAFCGYQRYQVSLGADLPDILTEISKKITVFDPDHNNQHIPYDGKEISKVSKKAGYYWLDTAAVNTGIPGEYPVLIKYRNDDGSDTTIGQVSVVVGSDYAVMTNITGTVMKNAGVSTVVNVISGEESTPATFKINGGDPISITVGMLTDADGNRIDTSKPGTYSGLTLTYQDMLISENFTLTVSASDHTLDYPAYDEPGSVTVGKGTTTTEDDFAGTGVANIELSATAKPTEKGVDVIFIVDLSSSMRYHVNNSQYACGPKYFPNGNPNTKETSDYTTQEDQLTYVYKEEWWQYTRMAAMENALCDMIRTLSASNTDVNIAIADFGDLDHYEFEDAVLDSTIGAPAGSKPYWDANLDDDGDLGYEFSNHVNFILGRDDTSYTGTGAFMSQPYWLDQTKHNDDYTNNHGWSYTGKLDSKIFTGDGTLSSGAFMDVKELETKLGTLTDDMKKQNGKRLGTNYDVGLETAYRLAYAREQANIASGDERDIICIFMSDGAAMQYNYLSGRSQTEAWSQCIIGETDEILTNNANKYVITSDPYDTSVNQNPYLQAMLKDMLNVLTDGNLIIPGTTTTYPAWDKNNYNGTDFFLAMKSIGVECDWELLWQIAYKLYTHHSTRTVALEDGSIIQRDGQNATGAKLLEAVTMSMRKPSYNASGNQYEYQTLSPYYYFYNAEGKNWWAEAIKGDSDKLYPVISRYAFKDHSNLDFYYGDVRNNFVGETTKTYDKNGNVTGTLALEGKDYIAGFRGLDMELYTIGFSLGTENRIDYTEAAQVLDNIATGPAYHYSAPDGDTLTTVLQSIASTISTSATRAYFTDTMGPNYDLSTEKTVVDKDGNTVTINAEPTVRVLEYTLDPEQPKYDENGELIGYERAKDDEGNYIVTVRETITFEGGKVAKSDQVYTIVTQEDGTQVKKYPDIWDDTTNLITGKYAIYNANKYVDANNTGTVDLTLDDSGLVFPLEAETFFWTIGMIGETEMVLEYQVYLEGSLEGELPLPTTYYDTNKEAVLHYINYLGNNCELDTVTPKFPWGDVTTSGLTVDKTVEATEDANEFVLTLEAFATGEEINIIKPADIVLVLDHSGSMRTPVGAPDVLHSPDTEYGGSYAGEIYSGEGKLTKNQLNSTLGQHRGYYVAQSTTSKWWFVLEYNAETQKWIGYSVPSTESIVNPDAAIGSTGTEHTKKQEWSYDDLPSQFNYYKTQYAVLYDAVKNFVADLKATGAAHRVSIIGFAGSRYERSRLYVGGDENAFVPYSEMYNATDATAARRTELYQKALKNVQNKADYEVLMNVVDSIETNQSFTCPAVGLKMATDLFTANEVDLADRDRIVVLFTDGIPNKMIDRDGNTDSADDIYDEIVKTACTAKQQGAQIYSISTTTLVADDDGRKFLSYASSDYPDATSYTTPGTPISTKKYTNEIGSAAALGNIFKQITHSTVTSSVSLDDTAILKEVLSDYFNLDLADDREIKIYTAPYDGSGDYTDDTNFGTWTDVTDKKDADGNKIFEIDITSSGSDGRNDTIDVTGFDYQAEYLSTKGRTVNGETYYGSKLIVQVPIHTRDGFWGGNNVPTNKYSTAIYTPETTGPDGETILSQPVIDFPMPEANVPINVEVTAKDKTIYYGGEIDSDKDGYEGDELFEQIIVGTQTDADGNIVNGSTVTVTTTTNPDGSTSTTFTPEADWMDDFAQMDWTNGSTTTTSDLSNTEPKDYTYSVTVTPNSDGTKNESRNPSNIAGNVDGGTVDNDHLAVPEGGVSDSDTGHIYILIPELTFKDSTTEFGTSTDGYDYKTNDYVDTEWVFMEDTADTTTAPEASGTAPALTLTYTPNTDDVQDGSFVTDTRVDVNVSIGDLDITGITNFNWQDDCTSGDHTDGMDISKHPGTGESNEFWVHVMLKIVPDTVVIDFGLDVVIDVLANDPVYSGVSPVLNGIRADASDDFGTDAVSGNFGQLSIDSTDKSKVRYTLSRDNGMQMNQEEVFEYQAKYTIKGQEETASANVTVIPATTIYYEDDFIDFSIWDYKTMKKTADDWISDGNTVSRDQAQDRPGDGLSTVDANNIYGFDSAYEDMSAYSMGSAKKVTLNRDIFAEAQFTFWGTGFDVVSLTSNTTGTIMVDVFDAADFATNGYGATRVKSYMVDTYYGYKYVLCEVNYVSNDGKTWERSVGAEVETGQDKPVSTGEPAAPTAVDQAVTQYEMVWLVDPAAKDTLYQVPVIKVNGLSYNRYTVVITADYMAARDHQVKDGEYDFYLDAIRIYDPANDGANSQTVKDAYLADGEGWPEYFELRNLLISEKDFNSSENNTVNGLVFIDNTLDADKNINYTIADYTNYGPNNEVYLAPGQAIAFDLNVPDPSDTCKVAGIHLAMKSVGNTAKVKVYDVTQNPTALADTTIETATDLYYDITDLNGKTVVITNTGESGDAILSITNVKVTYTAEHADGIEDGYFTVNQTVAKTAMASLMMMRTPSVAVNETTGTVYATVSEALNAAQQGDTVKLLEDTQDSQILVRPGVTLDLNGNILTADYVVGFDGADIVDNAGSGKLIASPQAFVLDENNSMLPVYDGEGYVFTVAGFAIRQDTGYTGAGIKVDALACPVDMDVVELLKNGAADNQLQVVIELTWETGESTGSQRFVFTDEVVASVYSSNLGSWNSYSKMFSMYITGLENVQNPNATILLVSDSHVEVGSALNP